MTRRLVLTLGAIALSIPACTSPAKEPSPTLTPVTLVGSTTTTATTLPPQVAVSRFRDCLVSRGVDIEEIPLDAYNRPRFDLVLASIDFSDPTTVEALAGCRSHLAGGVLDLSSTPELRSRVLEALKSFASCVRSHGVEGFPDPMASYDGIGSPFPEELIPYEDPDLGAGVEICRTRLARSVP